MGQYWLPVNLDKQEYVDPHKLGNGLKLGEMAWANPGGVGSALILLTAAMTTPRGGGDFRGDTQVVGRWAGDRIAIVGDYAQDSDLAPEHKAGTIYKRCRNDEDDSYTDISDEVCAALEQELGGTYTGTGWRDFEPDDTPVGVSTKPDDTPVGVSTKTVVRLTIL